MEFRVKPKSKYSNGIYCLHDIGQVLLSVSSLVFCARSTCTLFLSCKYPVSMSGVTSTMHKHLLFPNRLRASGNVYTLNQYSENMTLKR